MKQFIGWVIMDETKEFVIDGANFYLHNINNLTFSQLKKYCYSSEGQANKIIDEIYNWNKGIGLSIMFMQKAKLLLNACKYFTVLPIELKFLSTDGPNG